MTNTNVPDIATLLQSSDAFFATTTAPTTTTLIRSIISRSSASSETATKIVVHANATRVLLHSRVLPALEAFLRHKRVHGFDRERSLYRSMTPGALVGRLLKNRPLTFYNHVDKTMLRDGSIPPGCDWGVVGATREGKIKLHDYLSYDEIQIGALLGVSSPTFFINSGARHNEGHVGRRGTFEQEGIIVGLVGARFHKYDKMEGEHILVSESVSRLEFGYGIDGARRNPAAAAKLELFAALYSQPSPSAPRFYFPSYAEAAADSSGNFHPLPNGTFFNVAAYKARIRIPIECLLVDANARAHDAGRKAFVVVVGLGLGVWMKCDQQARWFVDVVGDVLQSVAIPHVADVDLNWIPSQVNTCAGVSSGGRIAGAAGNEIVIHFTTRSLAERLAPSNPPKLLVTSYAWDGNSFPGNEYWTGTLSGSGDSAAASCSTIAELQNAWINPGFLDRQFVIQPDKN